MNDQTANWLKCFKGINGNIIKSWTKLDYFLLKWRIISEEFMKCKSNCDLHGNNQTFFFSQPLKRFFILGKALGFLGKGMHVVCSCAPGGYLLLGHVCARTIIQTAACHTSLPSLIQKKSPNYLSPLQSWTDKKVGGAAWNQSRCRSRLDLPHFPEFLNLTFQICFYRSQNLKHPFHV